MVNVSGVVSGMQVQFLLDSGASHNFLPLSFCKQHKFDTYAGARVKVRMADSRVICTDLYCSVFVMFTDTVGGLVKFTVCDADIPCILGMPFLKHFNPLINWQTRTLQFLQTGIAQDQHDVIADINTVGGLQICLDAAQIALKRNIRMQYLHCPTCSHPHLDTGAHIKKHRSHICLQCNSLFRSPSVSVGNPLAYFLMHTTEDHRTGTLALLVTLLSQGASFDPCHYDYVSCGRETSACTCATLAVGPEAAAHVESGKGACAHMLLDHQSPEWRQGLDQSPDGGMCHLVGSDELCAQVTGVGSTSALLQAEQPVVTPPHLSVCSVGEVSSCASGTVACGFPIPVTSGQRGPSPAASTPYSDVRDGLTTPVFPSLGCRSSADGSGTCAHISPEPQHAEAFSAETADAPEGCPSMEFAPQGDFAFAAGEHHVPCSVLGGSTSFFGEGFQAAPSAPVLRDAPTQATCRDYPETDTGSIAESVEEVGVAFLQQVQQKASEISEVSLKSFKRDLKRGSFEEAFFCFSRELFADDDARLTFTHRTAHGTWGAGDKPLGDHAAETLESLKRNFPVVFTEPQYPVERSAEQQHQIRLKDEHVDPPRKKLYPLDQVELAALKEQLDTLLQSGRIIHSSSPYGAPILFAKKKDGGGLRMCIDYRALNRNTVLDRYPLPRIDELLGRLKGAKVFSKLDLRDGYHQIPMDPRDSFKTAFCTRYGQFEFTVMPFGLCNAPATFQRVMNRMFFDLLDRCVLVYLDDILIFSKDVEQHKKDLQVVFQRLAEFNFRLKESKCSLFLQSVEFLGHTVSADGVRVEQGKVDAIRDWPVPQNLNEVQQFLGLCNYYRRFIRGFAKIASPLTNLNCKNVPFVWDLLCQSAFDQLKTCLTSAPCLTVYDYERPTRVVCDASGSCVGSVLEQLGTDDQWHPVEFFSKRMSSAQSNYSATEREMLAVILSLERWRQYLIGCEFDIYTDHASLVYLQSQSKLSRRQAHWLDFLSQFSIRFVHVPGRANVVADALSRVPHLSDQPESTSQLATVITLGDESHVLSVVRKAQQEATADEWFALARARCDDALSTGYAVRNDVVCKLIGDYYAPVIPPSSSELKHVIMLEMHASALGGHLSVAKMHSALRKRFYWPRMRQDIVRFCKECAVCQQQRTSTQAPYGLLQPHQIPSRPFEHVSLDFIIGLPPTDRGHDAMLVFVDRFSKYVSCIPCSETITAADVARIFFDHIVCKFGMPLKLISDRDVRFTSLFWQALLKLLGCKLNLSSAYHPQTDGQTERFNRSLEQVLRCYCSPRQEDWDLFLPQVAFALNSTMHQGTRTSAYYCLFGFEPRLPIDTALSSLHDNKVQSVEDFVMQRHHIHQQVQQSLSRYSESMSTQANKHRRDLQLSIGDLVYLSTANLRLPPVLSRKLAPKWIGPFPVVAQISSVSYKLQLPAEYRQLHPVFHVSLLKRHHGAPPSTRAPLPIPDSGDIEFEVDRIVGKRFNRNRAEYLVQWKGYSPWDATWEPEHHLEGASDAVHEFESHGPRPRRRSR